MLFNSFGFVIFFTVVFVLHYVIPKQNRWAMLLIASYFFYMCWKVEYVVLILLTTAVHYFAGIYVEKYLYKPKLRKAILIASISISLIVLVFFKYFNFISESFASIFNIFSISFSPFTLNLLLPIGISFYTFQTLSYTIDVYRGRIKAEKHFGYLALYVSYFPPLVAGPIERADSLLPQLKSPKKLNLSDLDAGLKRMAIGFFKKIVIADTFAKGVNVIYNDVYSFSGGIFLVATAMFAIQIYCDFSGYSDIALGCSKIMGVDLIQNFKSPYLSKSIKEFWRRWHVSLSVWFKDYVYIPLGGNRHGKIRTNINLMATFLLSGLWHGANWTFVVWGGLHGLYQIIENLLGIGVKREEKKSKMAFIPIIITFAMVCFAWIFFRANTFSEAIYIIKSMFTGISNPIEYIQHIYSFRGMKMYGLLIVGFEFVLLFIIDYLQTKVDLIDYLNSFKTPIRWCINIAFILIILFLSSKGLSAEFIYFQF